MVNNGTVQRGFSIFILYQINVQYVTMNYYIPCTSITFTNYNEPRLSVPPFSGTSIIRTGMHVLIKSVVNNYWGCADS